MGGARGTSIDDRYTGEHVDICVYSNSGAVTTSLLTLAMKTTLLRDEIYILPKSYLPNPPYAATSAVRPLEKCSVEERWIRDLGDDSNSFSDQETRVSEAVQCYDRSSFRSVGHGLRFASRGLLIVLHLIHMDKIDTGRRLRKL